MPARNDDGFNRLEALVTLLREMEAAGDEVAIIGTTIYSKHGRVGWSSESKEWVARQFPKRQS